MIREIEADISGLSHISLHYTKHQAQTQTTSQSSRRLVGSPILQLLIMKCVNILLNAKYFISVKGLKIMSLFNLIYFLIITL